MGQSLFLFKYVSYSLVMHNHVYTCMTFDCLSCVFQMILWDWDLKHWYKPQYQVSAVFTSAHMLLQFYMCMVHSGNTENTDI